MVSGAVRENPDSREMTGEKLVSLHITIPELKGMLPGVATQVSTAFWAPLAEFVLARADAFEVVCQREDTSAIKLLMPLAETIERRHDDGALMFWGAVTPPVTRALVRGHGSGHESLWWWEMVLTADGSRVFELSGYGERMELFGLTEEEARSVLDMVPFSARTVRTTEEAADR